MDPAQRDRVHQLFELCRVLPEAERAIRLASVSASDSEVENEVRALLEAYDRCPEFLEKPALEQQAEIVERALKPHAQLAPGTLVGHFEIAGPLGAGGMGMVYRARDTLLRRDVALKFLPPALADDPGRRARFQAEARAVAALNHPNIATIYAVESGALVMELVPGLTLQERIQTGPIPLDEALRIAGQIADGLEAAHERGIVHRDLKPANIKLTAEDVVKVLDFGLAKASEDGLSDSRVNPFAMTSIGMILGTAGYMAPEQAAGKTVDKRADIWSFGVVLYEMLVGQPLFGGETNSDRLAAVLTKEPDFNQVPAKVRRLLQSCLKKDPKRRLRDIGDWLTLLEEPPATASRPKSVDSVLPWLIAAAAVIGLGVPRVLDLRNAKAIVPEIRADIVIPASDNPSSFALSPDGRRIAFAASDDGRRRLWVRALDSRAAQPLPGTEGAYSPFWSPDSRSVGFFADYKLKRIDLGGAQPQTLAPVPSNIAQGSWSAGGVILFSPGVMPLTQVSASGGNATEVTKLAKGQNNQMAPRFLPGGRQFLYVVNGTDPSIWLGSLDDSEPRRITSLTVGTDSAAEYLDPGWLVRVRQGVLEAQRFDVSRCQLSGDPVLLERSVSADLATMAGSFSVSRSGTIVWRSGAGDQRQLIWFNRSGQNVGAFGGISDSTLFSPELSPDGKRVATMHGSPGTSDIWVQEGLRNSRFTFDPADDRYAIWSPDGTHIAFASSRNGAYDLYEKLADGSGSERLLLKSEEFKRPNSWSPDGKLILYWTGQNNGDLYVLPLTGDPKPFPYVATPFHEQEGAFSPDGKWVAYQSDESGRFEIYVRPFPGPGGSTQVSVDGGHSARWRTDGKELYFLSPGLKMMAAKIVSQGTALGAETPEPLFQTNINQATNRQQYDVARDGRFLILTDLPNTSTEPIRLLLNWKPPSH